MLRQFRTKTPNDVNRIRFRTLRSGYLVEDKIDFTAEVESSADYQLDYGRSRGFISDLILLTRYDTLPPSHAFIRRFGTHICMLGRSHLYLIAVFDQCCRSNHSSITLWSNILKQKNIDTYHKQAWSGFITNSP